MNIERIGELRDAVIDILGILQEMSDTADKEAALQAGAGQAEEDERAEPDDIKGLWAELQEAIDSIPGDDGGDIDCAITDANTAAQELRARLSAKAAPKKVSRELYFAAQNEWATEICWWREHGLSANQIFSGIAKVFGIEVEEEK
jgi:hypothetical protein